MFFEWVALELFLGNEICGLGDWTIGSLVVTICRTCIAREKIHLENVVGEGFPTYRHHRFVLFSFFRVPLAPSVFLVGSHYPKPKQRGKVGYHTMKQSHNIIVSPLPSKKEKDEPNLLVVVADREEGRTFFCDNIICTRMVYEIALHSHTVPLSSKSIEASFFLRHWIVDALFHCSLLEKKGLILWFLLH